MNGKKTKIESASNDSTMADNTVYLLPHSITDPIAAEKILAVFRQSGWNIREKGDDEQKFRLQDVGKLLGDQYQSMPGGKLMIIDADLAIDRQSLETLMTLMDDLSENRDTPLVLSTLSNADPGLNPYAGFDVSPDQESLLESLVALLGPGQTHLLNSWPQHLLYFNAPAVEVLASEETVPANALSRLIEHGGQLLVADKLFVRHSRHKLCEEMPLEAHEERRPEAWGSLVQRLDSWLRSDLSQFSDITVENKPLTLHVSHSWGGGVAQWVESFISADPEGQNFQLRSEGPQSGAGAGQRLSLYLGNKTDAPMASWWLQPPIRSTAVTNPQYQEILREITRRYGVGRVIVSSLVGHSLDALATGLPTVQVLHDFYPVWPLLGIHPGQYLEQESTAALEQALLEHQLLPDFSGRDARSWQKLSEAWRACIVNRQVKTVAPSQSVADLLPRLDPAWDAIDIRIIPHGLPPMPLQEKVVPRDREDGKLRLLIPGRVQQGKGRDLLLEALPELTPYAHIYLVGTGKEGDVFFGKSGVDVILQYRREELPGILAHIGPQLAALLSVVPETFSYTLSEMLELHIPVVATRVGSLEERIDDGENGWLIEPDVASLVQMVKHLSKNRSLIESMADQLAELSQPDALHMLGEYKKLCPPKIAGQRLPANPSCDLAQINSVSFEQVQLLNKLRRISLQAEELQNEVEARTRWAEERQRALDEEKILRDRWVKSLEQQLDDEREERDRWVKSLNEQLDERLTELEAARNAFDHEQSTHEETRDALEQSHARYAQLKATHDWVLSSSSWRITRPLRAGRRMLGNFTRAQAWNPAKWPLLISQMIRILNTQGLKGALHRSQLSQHVSVAPETYDAEQVEEVGSSDVPASFPVCENPVVSIVIPVFNKWVYTAACLRSLAEISSRVSFEVIVVDDQSADETPSRLEEVSGLIRLRNEENLGFIGSCNRGAKEARGTYLVMLNNDTQVLEGWLDALLDTFEQFPDTGLAGARLIYPDGRLQEAGGIIFNDGSGWNYGKDDDAAKPEYHYTREVDYCSGACIMIRSELFEKLDGFDTYYSPAYYEDTDLAFRVRAEGLKVRLQARATIIHHEGITSGTDVSTGTKRYQEVNRKKFLKRWKDELTAYPEPVSSSGDSMELRRARDHRLKGRILIIDAYTPEPDQDSGSLRLCYLLDCFASLGYGVTFFADNRGHAGIYSSRLQQAGVEVIYTPWIDSLPDFFKHRGPDFSSIMISRHYVAANYISLLERYCPQASFIFDTVDLHYLREQRLAELENSLPLKQVAAQTRRSELAVIEAADATLVVSSVEKSVLEKDAPNAKVHVISNVHEVVGSRRTWGERKDIFFVGGYQHPPNVDAAIWFVNSIWPLVSKQLPELRFHLVGSKAPEEIRELHGNGVHFHGFVKSIEPFLDDCRLAVAPLRYGAGVKGKVNISMSRGQPMVATPMAVEGMFVTSGEEVLVAQGEEDFADAIVRLYQDERLWNHISAAGIENVRKYFSVETARLSLKELLRSLA